MIDVSQPFGRRGHVEAILAVKPARAVQNCRVELLRVVGRSDYHHALVVCETVQFVEQEGAIFILDQGVQVLQHHQTGRASPRPGKDNAHIALLRDAFRLEAFDVDAGLSQFIDQRFDRMRLAIARRPDKQRAALPRYPVLSIDFPRSEKAQEIFAQLPLQPRRQDQVLESRVLDRGEELVVFGPRAVLVNHNLAVNLVAVRANGAQKVLGDLIGLRDDPTPRRLATRVTPGQVDDIDEIVFPSVGPQHAEPSVLDLALEGGFDASPISIALAMDSLVPPDRTQSGFGILMQIERPRFAFDDRRARIHVRQFDAGEICNVIGRLAQRLANKLFQVVAHNYSRKRLRPSKQYGTGSVSDPGLDLLYRAPGRSGSTYRTARQVLNYFRFMTTCTRAVCNCVYGTPGASCLLARVS